MMTRGLKHVFVVLNMKKLKDPWIEQSKQLKEIESESSAEVREDLTRARGAIGRCRLRLTAVRDEIKAGTHQV